MNNTYERIEKIVAIVDCKSNTGNAFLIDRCHAVTVKHCVKAAYQDGEEIKLIFPKTVVGKVVEIIAVIDEKFDPEEDEMVLLTMEQELQWSDIAIGSLKLPPFSEAEVFGYDANNPVDGRWTRLSSANSIITNKNSVQDMLFDSKENREMDFSGLSGSPVIKDKYIIGIISQETLESERSVGIHGISMFANGSFTKKYGIPVEELINGSGDDFRLDLSVGGYNEKNNCISIAGEQEYLSIIRGKYKDKMDEISTMHRRGDVDGAWNELKKQIVEMNGNKAVPDTVQADYHLKLALWYIEDRNDIGKAQKKYEKAKSLNPDLNDCIFQALRSSVLGSERMAEELLEPIDSVSKFNVYLQICLNTQKADKAYKKYEEICETLSEDATTYYLLSIMDILRREYDQGLQHISSAIGMDRKVPFYHMVKGMLLFWKAIPRDVCLSDDLYPVMFVNGMLHLNEDRLQLIAEAGEAYRTAYNLAEAAENSKQMEFILSIWINTLSVDGHFHNDILEPIQLIRKKDPLNMTALLYMIQKKIELDGGVTIEKLEKRLKSEANKIGYVILLMEICLIKDDVKRAKQYLYEYKAIFYKEEYLNYWYEYIVKVEDKREKLVEYEAEILQNDNLEDGDRKRLLCLFLQLDCEREGQLEELLKEIYKNTHNRLDLLNLISFFQLKRKWSDLEVYSNQLMNLFGDVYGGIYQIKALIGMGKYDKALVVVEELCKLQDPYVAIELTYDRMVIMERQGKYLDAINFGKELLKKKPSGQMILKLASLYAMDGDEEGALHTLLKAEEIDCLSIDICQRISVCYLSINPKKAWSYAQKAVKLSEEQPEVMLWASDIANRTGRSEHAGIYYHHILTENPDHQMLVVKNIDEILEMIKASKEYAEKNFQMLKDGKMNSHIFVDSYKGSITYAEYFYEQWNAKEMIPSESGAHYYRDDSLDTDIKKVALDYSSCILLHEIGVLEVLGNNVQQVFIPGELFSIISEEIRRIPVRQQDLISSKFHLLEYCRNELKINIVDEQLPADIDLYGVKERFDAVYACTAESNAAIWVSDEYNEKNIRAIEVITALYKEGKISEEAFNNYQAEIMIAREDKVKYLLCEHPHLLANEIVLEEWYKTSLITAVNESYPLIILRNTVEDIEQENRQILQKAHVCEQLKKLKTSLLELKEKGKLFFLPIEEREEGLTYSNMLVSLLIYVQKRKIPLCIDDRYLNSYNYIGEAPVYNIFDIIKILLLSKKITLEMYCELNKVLYNAKIKYVLPDNRYIMYAIRLSEVDQEKHILKESEMLAGIRRYLAEAFSERSCLSHDVVNHVRIPEWEYFLFCLQRHARELIQKIWNSNMDYEKKKTGSRWVLYHYSQFAFDFGNSVAEKEGKRMQAIQLSDFIIMGMLLSIDKICMDNYFKWMYSWIDTYLVSNPDIKDKTLNFTKEFISDFISNCRKKGDKQEIANTNWLLATGIHYMPKEYKKAILTDERISGMYHKIYSVINIVLSEEVQLPAETYEAWENEVLTHKEKDTMVKSFQGKYFEFSWKYVIPAMPALIIKYKEGESFGERWIGMDFGKRLRHKDKHVRREEFKYVENYLMGIECGAEYLALMSQGSYEIAAERIMQLLDKSENYEIVRIENGLLYSWLNDKNTEKLIIPQKPDYFKNYYDWKNDSINFANLESRLFAALPIYLSIEIENLEHSNHNPVRCLHLLEQKLQRTVDNDEILNLIISLFSYVDGENGVYGKLYILFLKSVWNLFNDSDGYKNEPIENLIIWSYIWADKAMTCITKLGLEGKVNIEEYTKYFEKDTSINIRMDKFYESMGEEDVLSPVHMNLFKLCIVGTLTLCNSYKENVKGIACVMQSYFDQVFIDWMDAGVYIREAELSHKNDRNMFGSIFIENFYSLINSLTDTYEGKENNVIEKIINIGDRIQLQLKHILDADGAGMSKLAYLFLLSRENMEEYQTNMIEKIIEKQILNKEFLMDIPRYRLLSHIVFKLSGGFREKYLQHEYAKISGLLCTNQKQWEPLFEITVEMSQLAGPDGFLAFWEKCESLMKEPVDLQLVENIAWLQFTLPYEYAERIRNLRIKLELKA